MNSSPKEQAERLLSDAERLAQQGEREVAYALLTVALDMADNDPTIVERVRLVRDLFKDAGGSGGVTALPSIVFDEPWGSPEKSRASKASPALPGLQAAPASPAPRPVALPAASHPGLEPEEARVSVLPRVVLLLLLAAAAALAVTVARSPQRIDNLVQFHRFDDPVTAATKALDRHDREWALRSLDLAVEKHYEVSKALLLKARIYAETESTSDVDRTLAQMLSLKAEADWADLMAAARMYGTRKPRDAAALFFAAYERGAPAAEYAEIAFALMQAKDEAHARAVLLLALRVLPQGAARTEAERAFRRLPTTP